MRSVRGESGSKQQKPASVDQVGSKSARKPAAPVPTMRELGLPSGQELLVCADPASRTLVELLARVASSDVPVLISGETGTGKTLAARYVHETSGRAGPFVTVNCSAVAEANPGGPYTTLIGAGVGSGGPGNTPWFEAAAGGTLFLDEIGDLPLELQSKLLCALEDHEPRRTGGTANVRLVAATRLDLGSAVAAGRFRLDLLYRLNTADVALLPLRERMGDVVTLAEYFIRTYAKDLQAVIPTLSKDARTALTSYAWPGNVRELRNVIRFALLVVPAQELRREHLQLLGAQLGVPQRQAESREDDNEGPPELRLSGLLTQFFRDPGTHLLERLQGQVVAEAFLHTGRNQVRTAALLGISRNALRTLLKKHRLYEVRAYSSSEAERGRGNGHRGREG